MAEYLHILVVDDRPDTAAVLTQYLIGRGHRVAAALNGMEALSIFQRKTARSEPFHLIITDLNMPQLDGIGLLKEIHRRQLQVSTALLVDQAHQLFDAKREAERLGCLLVCEKPVDLVRIDQLLTAVSNRLNGVTTANEPFFGTTKIFRVSRPVQVAPPVAPPVARTEVIAEEFAGEESPPRPAVHPTVKFQRSASPEQAKVAPPQAQVVRRVRSPMPQDKVRQGGYPVAPATASFQRIPPNPLIPVAPVSDLFKKRPSEVAIPAHTPPVAKPSTGTFRRSIEPIPVSPARPTQVARLPSDPFLNVPETLQPPQTSPVSTLRLRRGVDGGSATSQLSAIPIIPVTCSACGAVFSAVRKPVDYNLPCLTCGAMNRIEPG